MTFQLHRPSTSDRRPSSLPSFSSIFPMLEGFPMTLGGIGWGAFVVRLKTTYNLLPLELKAMKPFKELECLEFFAGVANVFKASSHAGFPSVAIDIEYLQRDDFQDENPFDILSNAGLSFLDPFRFKRKGFIMCKSLPSYVFIITRSKVRNINVTSKYEITFTKMNCS